MALQLGDLLLPLVLLRVEALAAGRALAGGGDGGQPGFGTLAVLRPLVSGQRLLLEVGGEAGGVGERGRLGLEAGDGLLGLGDQRLLARLVAAELLGAGGNSRCARQCAGLALEVLLLDAEAGEDGAFGSLRRV